MNDVIPGAQSPAPVLLSMRCHDHSLVSSPLHPRPLCPLWLGVAGDCPVPFEEHPPLGHGQPEGHQKGHADDPQSDGVDVEVVHPCHSGVGEELSIGQGAPVVGGTAVCFGLFFIILSESKLCSNGSLVGCSKENVPTLLLAFIRIALS